MNDNEIRDLMKKAKVHSRAGYDQLHALRFLITFKNCKDKMSEAEFLSQAQTRGVSLGGYKDLKALLNQGRDIYRRLELITDRDLTAEIAPEQIFEEPSLFPEAEIPKQQEQKDSRPQIGLVLYRLYESMVNIEGHIVHIARTLDAISENLEALRQ